MSEVESASGQERFRVGDRVHHQRLGSGTVVGIGNGIVSVRLDDGSTRDLVATHEDLGPLLVWDEGRISPSWREIEDPNRFIPPLTPGERELALYLDRNLPAGWRIYVRPHMDADRPLLAALHPEAGGMFWDVVDWDLADFNVEQGAWVTQGRRFASPYRFMNEVRSRVYGVYVPEIGEALNGDNRLFAVIKAALYFARATTAQARSLADQDTASSHIETFGRDALARGDSSRIVPILDREGVLRESWFAGLDMALSHARRLPSIGAIKLTAEQRRRTQSKPGYTAIEGVAGSGKTLVLAYRAGVAADAGRRVLILTYNRTLTNYLRGVLGLLPFTYRPDHIAVLHFHELCRRIHNHHQVPLPALRTRSGGDVGTDIADDLNPRVLDVEWPESAAAAIDTYGVPPALRFDVVLIDEGQDFTPRWLELVGRLGAPEVVMAHDAAQRLYDREDALSNKAVAALFGTKANRLAPLGKAARLPAQTVRLAAGYAEHWGLDTPPLELAEEGLLPPASSIEAVQVDTPAAAAAALIAILSIWKAEPDYRAREVAVVVPEKAFGTALVLQLAELGMSTNHVFAVANTGALMEDGTIDPDAPPWRVEQAKKTAFAYGDSRLKVSTVHSFKGWEAERLILVLPFSPPSRYTIGAVYVGLTRSRGQLVLVGRVEEYGLNGLPLPAGAEQGIDEAVAERFSAVLAESERRKPRHPGSASTQPTAPEPAVPPEPDWLLLAPQDWDSDQQGGH